MSIAYSLLCFVLLYGLLNLIGGAVLSRSQFSNFARVEIAALAPVVGLSVLTLISTYLTLLQVPLSSASTLLMLAFLIVSIITICKRQLKVSANLWSSKNIVEYWIPFLFVATLIILPLITGGYQFVVLRGNGTDAFNYVSMADALSNYRLDWILSQPKNILANQSASLPFVQDLLKTRWSTAALLAFSSSGLSISAIEFEYAFTLGLLLVFFNAIMVAISAFSMSSKYTAWIAVAFIIGFWGQFILDLRAFSQIAALPLVSVLLACLLVPTKTNDSLFRYGPAVTSILFASLIFHYPEIIVSYLPGVVLIVLIRVYYAKSELWHSKNRLWQLFVFLFISAVLCAPLAKFLYVFAQSQTRFATSTTLGWEGAYFSWMKNPVRGLWGGGLDLGLGVAVDRWFVAGSLAIGILLTFSAALRFIGFARLHREWRMHVTEVSMWCLVLSGIAGAAFLFWRGNPWAGGKVISFYALLIPIFLSHWLSLKTVHPIGAVRDTWQRLLIYAVVGWIAMNAILACVRVFHSYEESDFGRYIYGHGENKKVSAQGIALLQTPTCPKKSRVAVFDPTVWGREFRVHYAEGNGYVALVPPFTSIRSDVQGINALEAHFDCVFANRSYFDSVSIASGESAAEFFTVDNGADFVALVDIKSEYGVELNTTSTKRYSFVGSKNLELDVLGRTSGYNLALKFCPVSPRSADEAISISLNIGSKRIAEFELVDCVDKTFFVAGTKSDGFIHAIQIENKDRRLKPVFVGSDTRDLRFRVEVLEIRVQKISANVGSLS